MHKKTGLFIALSLVLGSAHAMQTSTYEIRELAADPNPVSVKNGPATVKLTITVKPMGSLGMSTDACDVDIDFGNGTRLENQHLGLDGKVRSSFETRYDKPGSYTIHVSGSPGLRACDGSKTLVLDAGDFVPEPPSAVPPKPVKKEPAPLQPSMITPHCPPGWEMVPGSQYGSRFSCRIAPPPPIQCDQGTSYFSSDSTIGCR